VNRLVAGFDKLQKRPAKSFRRTQVKPRRAVE
jgi:hypothetical protein